MIVAFLHMVLGEMVPKSVALTAPERSAVLLPPLQAVFTFVLWPFVWFSTACRGGAPRLLRVEPADELAQAHTSAELAIMMEESVASGELEATEHVLLAGALGFPADRRVAEVMAPASQLVTVPTTATVACAELVHRSGHSRVLVVGSSRDDVVGFLHAKDLLRIPTDRRDGLLPPGVVRVALRVRPDDRLSDVLPRDASGSPARGGGRRPRRPGVERASAGHARGRPEAIVGDIRDEWGPDPAPDRARSVGVVASCGREGDPNRWASGPDRAQGVTAWTTAHRRGRPGGGRRASCPRAGEGLASVVGSAPASGCGSRARPGCRGSVEGDVVLRGRPGRRSARTPAGAAARAGRQRGHLAGDGGRPSCWPPRSPPECPCRPSWSPIPTG